MEEQNNSQIVYFECCTNCKSHSWCTRHDQTKYQAIFLDIKNAINEHIPSLQVAYNIVPKNYFPLKKQNNDNRYIDGLTKKSVYFPGLGAFQVYFKNILIFSKYQSDRWPQSMQIVNLLLQIQKEFQKQGNLKKYEMFQLRENNLMRMRQNQQLTSRQDRDLDQQTDLDYMPLSLAEYERGRSGSKSKKRQFGNRAYNKNFQNVQKQLDRKQVRNIQQLYIDQNSNISERQYSSNKKYKQNKPQSSQSHKFVFISQSNTAYSRFTHKSDNKSNNVIKNINDRQTYYKQKEKMNSSNTRVYEMRRNSSNKRIGIQNSNSQKIKHLKNDIDKLTKSNNKKMSDLSIMNSQMPSVIKRTNDYNETLMKIPEFVKKKSQYSQQKQILMRLDNIDQQNGFYFEQGKQIKNGQRKTPYKIMNQWDKQLQMLETRFEKFQKKVEIMKQKKQQFEDGSNIDHKIAQLMKADRKQSKQQKQIFMFVKKNNHNRDRNMKKSKDYLGISPDQKSQKLKKIYGKGKLTQDVSDKKYYYVKHQNNNDLSDQDNELYIDEYSFQFQNTNRISFNYGAGIKMKPQFSTNNLQKQMVSNLNENFYKDKTFQGKTKRNSKQPIQFQTLKNNLTNCERQNNSNFKNNQNNFVKRSSKNLNQPHSRTSNHKNQSKTSSSFNKYHNKNQINNKGHDLVEDNRNSFSNKKLHESNIKQNKLNNMRNKINEALRESEQGEYLNNYGVGVANKINSKDKTKYEIQQETNSNTFVKNIKYNQKDKVKNKYDRKSNNLPKNQEQKHTILLNQQNKDNFKDKNHRQSLQKSSIPQNNTKNNKILASRNNINKLNNKRQQNNSLRKDVHRSRTSRNPSEERKQASRNNSKNNLSSRSISTNKGIGSKTAQNKTRTNQFKQIKSNSKSKTDNNFYDKKNKRIDQRQYVVAQQSDSNQSRQNLNNSQQSELYNSNEQNNTNKTANNKVNKNHKINNKQQNQIQQNRHSYNNKKQNLQSKTYCKKQRKQNKNEDKQQQLSDEYSQQNNLQLQLSHSEKNDSISSQSQNKLNNNSKLRQQTIQQKDKNCQKDNQNNSKINKKKKIRVKQHKLSTKQVNISITNGQNKNNLKQEIRNQQNQYQDEQEQEQEKLEQLESKQQEQQEQEEQEQKLKQYNQNKYVDQNQINNQNIDQNQDGNDKNVKQGNKNKSKSKKQESKDKTKISTKKKENNHQNAPLSSKQQAQTSGLKQSKQNYGNQVNENVQVRSSTQQHQQNKTTLKTQKQNDQKDIKSQQQQQVEEKNIDDENKNNSNVLIEQTKSNPSEQNQQLQDVKQNIQNNNNVIAGDQRCQPKQNQKQQIKNSKSADQNKKQGTQSQQILKQHNHDGSSQDRSCKDVDDQFKQQQNIGDQNVNKPLKQLNKCQLTNKQTIDQHEKLHNENQKTVNEQISNNKSQQQKQCSVKQNDQNCQQKDKQINQENGVQQLKEQNNLQQQSGIINKSEKKDSQNTHLKTKQQKQKNKQSKFVHETQKTTQHQKVISHLQQKQNNQNTFERVQQNVKNKIYQGPTNKQLQQNGQLMVGSEISQKKTYKDASIQSSFNEASCQTELICELKSNLTDITNKTNNQSLKNNQLSESIKENKENYERKLDMKRANILNNLYYQTNDIFKIYPKILEENKGKQYQDHEYSSNIALKGLQKCQWKSLRKIYKSQTLFPQQKKWNLSYLTIDDKKNTALGSVLKILSTRKTHLITRLFENNAISPNGLYGIWLCHNSAWTPVIVDDYVPVIQRTQIPAFLNTQSKYIWPLILQKAISKLCGGYLLFNQLLIPDIFKMLTGSNFVAFKIKQDPSMNSKAIRYISENQNKNFILHCQKHKKQVPKNALVKLPQVLTIQSTQSIDKKDLIQLQIDQNQPFWMKFQIFCQSFKCINLLHLRQTYLFTHIPVTLYPSSYTVVQLIVQGSTSANISLNHLGDEDHLPKTTRVILYRQQQKSILKLVGQAKEKNKKLIFFDCQLRKGRYFLFVQGQKNYSDAIISYSGDDKAYMKVIENIENITMKNKNNEYIPVSRENKIRQKQKQAPKYLNNIFDINVSHRGSDNNSQKFERLKNQFLDYLANEK